MRRVLVQLSFLIALIAMMTNLSAYAQSSRLGEEEVQLATEASQNIVQKEAARLLLFASLISVETGEIIEVSRDVRIKYHAAFASTVAPIPLTVSGGIIAYLTKKSFRDLNFVFASLNNLLSLLRQSVTKSVNTLSSILDNAAFRASFKTSVELSASLAVSIYNATRPFVKLVFNRGFGLASGTSTASSSLSGMSFMMFHDVEAALDYNTVRYLLGYNKKVSARLDKIISDLSSVYNLDTRNREILRDVLRDAMIEQAARNDFRDDAEYDVNVIGLMAEREIISTDLAAVTHGLQALFIKSTQYYPTNVTGLQALVKDLETIAMLGAVIEEYLNKGVLSEARAKEAQMMLGNLERTMNIVRRNFQ